MSLKNAEDDIHERLGAKAPARGSATVKNTQDCKRFLQGKCNKNCQFRHRKPSNPAGRRKGTSSKEKRAAASPQKNPPAKKAKAAKTTSAKTGQAGGSTEAERSGSERGHGPRNPARPALGEGHHREVPHNASPVLPGSVPTPPSEGVGPRGVGHLYRSIGLQYIRGSITDSTR
ncbi:unnamed protein product, partial [Laminaria digitata]